MTGLIEGIEMTERQRGPGFYNGITPWNEQSTLYLKNRWEAGAVASLIARELKEQGYSITRNAVIGKAHRMNYKQPPRGMSPKAPRNKPRKRIIVPATDPRAQTYAIKKMRTRLPTAIATKILDPNNPGISIMELTSTTCRAIVVDGTYNTLATYCGETVKEGKAYCEPHCQLFFDETRTRQRVR
jgi:hypothetical protein